jgi:hypothetical protein
MRNYQSLRPNIGVSTLREVITEVSLHLATLERLEFFECPWPVRSQ